MVVDLPNGYVKIDIMDGIRYQIGYVRISIMYGFTKLSL